VGIACSCCAEPSAPGQNGRFCFVGARGHRGAVTLLAVGVAVRCRRRTKTCWAAGTSSRSRRESTLKASKWAESPHCTIPSSGPIYHQTILEAPIQE
jgi:hypothetical protein